MLSIYIMNIIRFNPMIDRLKKEKEYILIDNFNLKHIKIKRNILIDFLFKELELPKVLDEILEKANSAMIDEKKVRKALDIMRENNWIYFSFFPLNFNYKDIVIRPLECVIDDKFGKQVASYERYETDNYTRFDIANSLKSKRVCVIGVGTIGGMLSVLLANTMIGNLTIIDGDIVELSNLFRQPFYNENDLGKYKATCIKKYISKSMPGTKITTILDYIDSIEKANKYLSNFDLIIQTGDFPRGSVNNLINEVCVKKSIPILYISNNRIGPFYIPKISKCYKCWDMSMSKENKEVYLNTINAANSQSTSNFPASSYGQIILIYYTFDIIFSYLVNNKCDIINSSVDIKGGLFENNTQIKLEGDSYCGKCQ